MVISNRMTLTLTLIRGLPGSGKSTLAKTLPANHFEADMYFIQVDGQYEYQADKIAVAHQWCQKQTYSSLNKGQSAVVANTFVRRWEMMPYVKMAKRFGARLKVIECTGEYDNIHGVDESTILAMKKRWQTWQSVPQL